MKRIFLFLLTLGGLTLSANVKSIGGIERLHTLGFVLPSQVMKIPSITAYQDRAAVNLMDQGRVSILYFWSTYSPPSLGDFELLQALGEYFGEDKLFIGLVNLNETHWLVEAEPAVQSLNLPVFLYPQSTNLTAFTTGSVPAAYILDQQGRLVASIHGNAPWNHPDVKRSLDELIAQG